MSLTIEDVQRWDPGAIRAVGDAARTRAQTSIDTADDLPTFPDWTGPGSEEAKQAIAKTRKALMRDADVARAAARSADAAAVNVQIIKDNLQQVLNMARDCDMVVDPVAGTVRPALPSMALPNDWHNAEVLQQAITCSFETPCCDAVSATRFRSSVSTCWLIASRAAPGMPLRLPNSAGCSATSRSRSFWLSDFHHCSTSSVLAPGGGSGIGRTSGGTSTTSSARSIAAASCRSTVLACARTCWIANPGFYGLSADDITRYTNALKVQQGMNHQRGSDPDPSRQRPVMLWKYEPLADGGQGRAAIAIGNPDYADNTTVIVPGTGSSVKGGWLSDGHNDAMNLWNQANAADPNHTHSVISWMGYDAPDSFGDLRIGNPDLARTGGDLLAADVNGLGVTHRDPSQHLTVIGHSYGSTTVADAFAHSGMHAKDAVLLGCPGTDLARSAADFHLDGGNVYVGSASTDPVSYIGTAPGYVYDELNRDLGYPLGLQAALGTDPAGDAFGSVRFDAEVAGRDGLDTADHSHYYEMGSESLRAMTYIATGESGELGDEGLLADGRRQPHVDLPTEIDLPFGGEIDLPPVGFDVPGSPAYIDPETGRPSESVTKDHAF